MAISIATLVDRLDIVGPSERSAASTSPAVRSRSGRVPIRASSCDTGRALVADDDAAPALSGLRHDQDSTPVVPALAPG